MANALLQLCNEVTAPWWLWMAALVVLGRVGSRMEKTLAHAARRRETLWERHENFWWRSAFSRVGWCMTISAGAGGFGLFVWVAAAIVVTSLRMPMEAQPALYVIPPATLVPVILLLGSLAGLTDKLTARMNPAADRDRERAGLRWAQLREPGDEHAAAVQMAAEMADLVLGRGCDLDVLSWDAPGGGLNAALVEVAWRTGSSVQTRTRCELPRRAVAVSRQLFDLLDVEAIAAIIVCLLKSSDRDARVDRAGADQSTVLAMHDPAPLLSALRAVIGNPGACAEGVAELALVGDAHRAPCHVRQEWLTTRVVWFTEAASRVELLDRMDGLRRATHSTV